MRSGRLGERVLLMLLLFVACVHPPPDVGCETANTA